MLSIPYALDAVNFLSADVRNLFGPYINVFLVTGRHWTQTDVGLVTTGSGLIGIALQTPIGAAIDLTRSKRAVIVLTMAAMTVSALIIVAFPTFWPLALATGILALAGDAFAPAVSAQLSASSARTSWPGGSAATPPTTTAATWPLRSSRAASDTCSRSGSYS